MTDEIKAAYEEEMEMLLERYAELEARSASLEQETKNLTDSYNCMRTAMEQALESYGKVKAENEHLEAKVAEQAAEIAQLNAILNDPVKLRILLGAAQAAEMKGGE